MNSVFTPAEKIPQVVRRLGSLSWDPPHPDSTLFTGLGERLDMICDSLNSWCRLGQ